MKSVKGQKHAPNDSTAGAPDPPLERAGATRARGARRFALDSLALTLSQYVARAVLLARGAVAAGVLGPAGFGGWNALNLVLEYGGYASGGVLQGLDLELPAAVRRREEEKARAWMSAAWTVLAVGALVSALVLVGILSLGVPVLTRGHGWGAPLAMLGAAWIQLAILYHVSVLKARARFQHISVGVGMQALLGGGSGLAMVAAFGIWGLIAGWIAGSLAALLWLRAGAPDAPLGFGDARAALRLLGAGAPVFGFFLASLLLRSVDRLALVHVGASEALGHYSLGLMAAGLVLYLPEATGSVLFPRVSAAARKARDPQSTRREVLRAHRAVAVLLPLPVGVAMVVAGPLVKAILPAYSPSVDALRMLSVGALLFGAATIPAYFLLGSGRAWELLGIGVVGAALSAALVFSVAVRDPRPLPVAAAATAGYAAFAIGTAAYASRALTSAAGERATFLVLAILPPLIVGGLVLATCYLGPPESPAAAVWRSAAVALGYMPVLGWLGRGLGLRDLGIPWPTARVTNRS